MEDLISFKNQGNDLFRHGASNKASEIYEEGIKFYQDQHEEVKTQELKHVAADIFRNLSLIQFNKQDFEQSIESIEESIKLNNHISKSFYRKSLILYELEHFEAAQKCAKEAYTLVLKEESSDSKPSAKLIPPIKNHLQLCIETIREVKHGKFNVKKILKSSSINKVDYRPQRNYVNPNVEVFQTATKGKGVRALRDIKRAELVLAAHPLVQVTGPYLIMADLGKEIYEQTQKNKHIKEKVKQLSHTSKSKEDSLSLNECISIASTHSFNIPSQYDDHSMDKFISTTKCRQFKDMRTIYLEPCLLNHACASNTTRVILKGIIFIRARTDIKAGTELTTCYHMDKVEMMHNRALNEWDFSCDCEYCQYVGHVIPSDELKKLYEVKQLGKTLVNNLSFAPVQKVKNFETTILRAHASLESIFAKNPCSGRTRSFIFALFLMEAEFSLYAFSDQHPRTLQRGPEEWLKMPLTITGDPLEVNEEIYLLVVARHYLNTKPPQMKEAKKYLQLQKEFLMISVGDDEDVLNKTLQDIALARVQWTPELTTMLLSDV